MLMKWLADCCMSAAVEKSDAGRQEWIMTAMGMVWLAVFPLWQDGSYQHITRARWIGMLVLTGATVCCALWAACLRLMRGEKLRIGWMQAAGLAYFGLVALSAIFGSWAGHIGASGRRTVLLGAYRYEGLITQLCYGAVFLSMSTARVKLRPLLHAASCTLLVYLLFVLLQYAGINVLGLFPAGMSVLTNYEFQGPIGNIDMVVGYLSIVMTALLAGFVWLAKPCRLWLAAGLAGALLLMMMEVQCGLIMLAALMFLLIMLALHSPDCRWRVLLILAGVLLLAGLRLLVRLPWLDDVQTLSLRWRWQALFPVAGALLMALAARWLYTRPGRQVKSGTVAVVAVALVILALTVVYLTPFPEGSGLWELRELLCGRARDSFGSERIGIWRLTLEMCRENLLWGTGPDLFLHAMDRHLWLTGQNLVQRFDNPHNLFLGVLANSGLPALGMYMTLTLAIPACALCRAEKVRERLPLALCVLCYLVQGMFTFSICLVTPMFWAALGMLAGWLERTERS